MNLTRETRALMDSRYAEAREVGAVAPHRWFGTSESTSIDRGLRLEDELGGTAVLGIRRDEESNGRDDCISLVDWHANRRDGGVNRGFGKSVMAHILKTARNENIEMMSVFQPTEQASAVLERFVELGLISPIPGSVSGVSVAEVQTGFYINYTAAIEFDREYVNRHNDKYEAAVADEDFVSAQSHVDSKARDAGFTIGPVYHGTSHEFTVFEQMPGTVGTVFGSDAVQRTGFFFSDTEEMASTFGGKTGSFFLKANKVADLSKGFMAFDDKLRDDLVTLGMGERYLMGKHADEIWEMFDGEDGVALVGALRHLGYDAVRFYEPRMGESIDGEGYIVFAPEQIRSAKAVERMDDGSLVPLGSRFAEGPDFRGGVPAPPPCDNLPDVPEGEITPADDAAYLAAVREGRVDDVKRLVALAARKSGFTHGPIYHGTNHEFTSFNVNLAGQTDDGFYGSAAYFAPHKSDATEYGGRIMAVYLKAPKLFVLPDSGVSDDIRGAREALATLPWMPPGLKPNTTIPDGYELQQSEHDESRWGGAGTFYAVRPKEEMYDAPDVLYGVDLKDPEDAVIAFNDERIGVDFYKAGFVMSLLKDVGRRALPEQLTEHGYNAMVITDAGGEPAEFAVWDTSRLRSAGPVSFDDNGEIIPLSRRFSGVGGDIRGETTPVLLPGKGVVVSVSPELAGIQK